MEVEDAMEVKERVHEAIGDLNNEVEVVAPLSYLEIDVHV